MEPKALTDLLHANFLRLGSFEQTDTVVELRVLNVPYRGTIAGYFANPLGLVDAAARLDCDPHIHAIYITLNPVRSECLARASNRTRDHVKQGETTVDRDIAYRRLLLIDFDPRRPSGISSTNAEHDAALDLARACRQGLTADGWPEPYLCDSGNGAHLLYLINLPNDDASRVLVREVLVRLGQRWDSNTVEVDTKVFNAARITKLYGTMTRKGDATPDRPHRRSAILEGPERLEDVPQALLEGLAGRALTLQIGAPRLPTRPQPGQKASGAAQSRSPSRAGVEKAPASLADDTEVLAFFEQWGVSELRESGVDGWYKGSLDHPSHQTGSGKPGFALLPSRQIWKDQRSGKSGGPIQFLEQYHGMSRAEAGATVAKHFERADLPVRHSIEWDDVRFHEITTEVVDRLLEANADIFERADHSVEIDRKGNLRRIEAVRTRDIIARFVDFYHHGKQIAVPELIAKTLVARPSPGFRSLTAVIRTPTLRPDGSILEAPGFDAQTGLYYLPDNISYSPMTQQPTRTQALAAMKNLLEVLQDFPFTTDAHRAAAVSFLVTCVLRSAVDGVVPGFGFDAPDPGTGKTLCARLGGWLARGAEPAIETYRHEVEEQEKRATATLLAGKTLVIWDNIVHRFGSEVTDLLITGRYFTGRLLGTSMMPELLNNTVWCFNGNNLRLNNADSIRRLIWIRMVYPKGDPLKRTGFRIGNLPKWVLEHREELVRACLTIARYGVLNPRPLPPYASFEEWSSLIRQPVVDLMGGDAYDPLNGFPTDDPDIHEESAAIAAFYTEWLAVTRHPTRYNVPEKWTITEMIKVDSLREIIAQLTPGEPERRNHAFGEILKRWKNRAVMLPEGGEFSGCWKLISNGPRIKTGVPYALVPIP